MDFIFCCGVYWLFIKVNIIFSGVEFEFSYSGVEFGITFLNSTSDIFVMVTYL